MKLHGVRYSSIIAAGKYAPHRGHSFGTNTGSVFVVVGAGPEPIMRN